MVSAIEMGLTLETTLPERGRLGPNMAVILKHVLAITQAICCCLICELEMVDETDPDYEDIEDDLDMMQTILIAISVVMERHRMSYDNIVRPSSSLCGVWRDCKPWEFDPDGMFRRHTRFSKVLMCNQCVA